MFLPSLCQASDIDSSKVPEGFCKVFARFHKGFLGVAQGFPQGFPRVSARVSTRVSKGFRRVSKGGRNKFARIMMKKPKVLHSGRGRRSAREYPYYNIRTRERLRQEKNNTLKT